MREKLSPSEVNVLEALRNNNQRYKSLKVLVKNRDGGSITDRGLSKALKELQILDLIERLPETREYHIKPTGEDYLGRRKITLSIESEPVCYSKEIVLKIDLEPLYRGTVVADEYLQNYQHFPSPVPVQALFFSSKEIEYVISLAKNHHLYHDYADIREFSDLVLEDHASSLKPYLNEIIFDNCLQIASQYERYVKGLLKDKPTFDIFNTLNFSWGFAFRFDGKRIMDEIKRDPLSPKTRELKKEIEERLVGLLLLSLSHTWKPGCDLIIPLMISSGMLDRKEGEELQVLYEKMFGKTRRKRLGKQIERTVIVRIKWKEFENARRQFIIRALEHLKKGKGLHIAKTGVHGIEDTGLTEDDVFSQILNGIEKKAM